MGTTMTQLARFSFRSPALGALLATLLSVAVPAPAAASRIATDPRWLPWIGCWTPTSASSDVAPSLARTQRVCVMPVDGTDGVDVVGVADGAVVSRMRVNSTGERRPVSREGCEGWETARWAAGAGRLFLRSEMTCAGIERVSTGIIAIASPGEWVDVEVVNVRGQRATRVVRYRSAPDSTSLDRDISTALGDRELARRTARLGGAALPTIADVVEASREVDPAVVEAWLLQRMPRFDVDARQLRRLASARVPGSVIDLVVALSNPELFHERFATRSYTLVRLDAPRQPVVALEGQSSGSEVVSPSIIIQGGSYDDRSSWGGRCDRCSDQPSVIYYDQPSYAPYGYYPYWPYGAYYPSYPYYPNRPRPEPEKPAQRPPVIVNGPSYPKPAPTRPSPEPSLPEEHGRAVKGRGYTRSSNGSTAQPTPPPQAEPNQPREPRQAQPRPSSPPPEQPQVRQAKPAPAPAPAPPPRTEPKAEAAPREAPKPGPPKPEEKPERPARTAKVRPPAAR